MKGKTIKSNLTRGISFAYCHRMSGIHVIEVEIKSSKKILEYASFSWEKMVQKMEGDFSKETLDKLAKILRTFNHDS